MFGHAKPCKCIKSVCNTFIPCHAVGYFIMSSRRVSVLVSESKITRSYLFIYVILVDENIAWMSQRTFNFFTSFRIVNNTFIVFLLYSKVIFNVL